LTFRRVDGEFDEPERKVIGGDVVINDGDVFEVKPGQQVAVNGKLQVNSGAKLDADGTKQYGFVAIFVKILILILLLLDMDRRHR